MTKLRKLLILDDDPHYSGMLALKIRQNFPELLVTTCDQHTVMEGYDIYVLDNDFQGEKWGAKLAETVRIGQPESLVIILSGTLEKSLLKRLVNCHAAGVFDKSEESELPLMFALMEKYLLNTECLKPKKVSNSFSSPFKDISAMLSAWNERLHYEEKSSL